MDSSDSSNSAKDYFKLEIAKLCIQVNEDIRKNKKQFVIDNISALIEKYSDDFESLFKKLDSDDMYSKQYSLNFMNPPTPSAPSVHFGGGEYADDSTPSVRFGGGGYADDSTSSVHFGGGGGGYADDSTPSVHFGGGGGGYADDSTPSVHNNSMDSSPSGMDEEEDYIPLQRTMSSR